MELEKLLEPGRIGGMNLSNRLIFAPIGLRAAGPEGSLTEELMTFYEERARGGVGLIIMGHTLCWREENTGYCTGLWSDEHIPQFADMARRVHSHGGRLAVQLGGRGTRRADGKSMAPSPMRYGFEKNVPREITTEEIEYWVECYGRAALRARKAGLDGVEIHAAHGKLVSLFLSPYTNRRTDAYGGTPEKRARFAGDIVRSVRRHAGEDFPVIFRYSADDMLEGGNTPAEGVEIGRIMSEEGVSALEISAGNQEKGWNTSFSYFFPHACLRHLAGSIRNAVKVPIIAVGKIGDPFTAEHILREHDADFVSLGRPLVADPCLLKKAKEGRGADIRRCIYCLNCFTGEQRKERIPFRGITCTVNPEALREREWAELRPAACRKNILIAGGGPAGMAAATALARRGHAVELHEASGELGGQWLAASRAAYKSDFRTLVPWLKRSMDQAGVRIRLHSEVTAESVAARRPDLVVVATGARPRSLPLPLPEAGPQIVQGMDIIMDKARTGRKVIVVGGRYIGMEVAAKLGKKGLHVSLVEAMQLGHGTLPRLLGVYRNMLVEADVHIYDHSPLLRLTSYGADIAHAGSMLALPADTIVLAVGTEPRTELRDALQAAGIEHHAVGDCRTIGDALYAIREGAELAFRV